MMVAGMNLGITRRELIPFATKPNAAGSNALGLIGGFITTINTEDGNNVETRQLCYVSEIIFTLFLSKQASEDLGQQPNHW